MKRIAGFTLLEVMIVVAVMAILASIALPSFTYLSRVTRVKNAATTVYLSMLKARSEAVKRDASITITPNTPGDWSGGWTIKDPANNVLSAQEAFNQAGVRANRKLNIYDLNAGGAAVTSVVYLGSGRISGSSPTFSISYGTTGVTDVARCVAVNPSGSPVMKKASC